MTNLVELIIFPTSYSKRSELLSLISEWNHAGHFKHHGEKWIIYFEESAFDEKEVTRVLGSETIPFQWKVKPFELDPELKWNGMYQPVRVSNYCFIRSPIHPRDINNCKHEITIVPTLTFGMGHHVTTQLMLEIMATHDFENKAVLDIGTGTGLLGIIALKENAKKVMGIDIEPSAVKNAVRNARLNGLALPTQHAIISDLEVGMEADYILANIVTPVHLTSVKDYHFHLKPEGIVILSGMLNTDIYKITKVYEPAGFELLECIERAGWLVMSFKKKQRYFYIQIIII